MLPILCYIMPNYFKYISLNDQLFMKKKTIVIPIEVKYKERTHAGRSSKYNLKVLASFHDITSTIASVH